MSAAAPIDGLPVTVHVVGDAQGHNGMHGLMLVQAPTLLKCNAVLLFDGERGRIALVDAASGEAVHVELSALLLELARVLADAGHGARLQ